MRVPSGSHMSSVKYCLSSAGTKTFGMNLKLHADTTSRTTSAATVAYLCWITARSIDRKRSYIFPAKSSPVSSSGRGRRTNSCMKKGVCVMANTQLNISETPMTTTSEESSSPVIWGE